MSMPKLLSSKRVLLLLAAGMSIAAAPAGHYAVSRSISGPDGGWDYAKVDPATRTLYVARGADVTAVDLAHGDAVRAIGTIARGHAVVPVAGGKLLLVTSGHDDSVRLLDTSDGHEVASIPVGKNPDAAFIDPTSGNAVVMNAKDGTVSIIDIAARKVTGTITLKPGLEYAVSSADGTLFVNNEDANEIETANLKTGKVGAAIALTGCTGPTGLALDAKTGVLISACGNGKAAVVDVRTKKLRNLLSIGQGPDAVILDAARRTAFIPNGRDGTLSVIALDGPGGPKVVDTVKTGVGARTGTLDASDGALYLPTANFAPPATAGARPTMVPGSFHVIVVTRQ